MELMRTVENYFERYTDSDEFFLELQRLILKRQPTPVEIRIFKENIERKIWPMLNQTKYFVVEENYTETEWKDMISEHYIHTRYSVENTVVRIHLFNDNEDIENSYMGYFTLRKINNNDMVLSFIYPNWKVLRLEACNFGDCCIVTVKKMVHIFAEEFEILTTPYFVQDGAVTCCAHATIIMMSCFLHLRFGYKKIRIPEIAQGYLRREKQYPTKGLIPEQIMEVLTNNRVYIRPIVVKKGKLTEAKKEDIKGTIKAHLRSGLPALMLIDKHAVLIVGFREGKNADGVVFFDDSGVLIHNINQAVYSENEKEYDNFVYNCEWNYIFDFVEKNPGEIVTFLVPFHEKIFVNYDDVFCRCLFLEQNMGIENESEETYVIENKRFFIADNVACKKFINEHVLDRENVKEAVDQFICSEQPHYLWCFEFEFEGEYYILFINSTYNMHDKENNIYINKNCEPFHVERRFHTIQAIGVRETKKEQVPLFTKRLSMNTENEEHDVFLDIQVTSKAANTNVKRCEEALEQMPRGKNKHSNKGKRSNHK